MVLLSSSDGASNGECSGKIVANYADAETMVKSSLFAFQITFLLLSMLRGVRTMATKTTMTRPQNVIFHWFRHGDLRLHDNPALLYSTQLASSSSNKHSVVVPVFCFDPQIFGAEATTTTGGSLKCGARRAQFITECVTDLRTNLQQQCGSELLVAHGRPDAVFDDLLQKYVNGGGGGADDDDDDVTVSIVCQEEVVKEELDAVQSVRAVLNKHKPQRPQQGNVNKLHTIWGSTMYDVKDLTFAQGLVDMPDVFTPFRNKVEKKSVIRSPLAVPSKSKMSGFWTPPDDSTGTIEAMKSCLPTLKDLGYTADQIQEAETHDPRGVMEFRGGETAALARVQDYIWEKDCLKEYFDTRNGMIGADYSTKFSPWLALGCLSPRYVAAECQRYEKERVANKSTYWVVFELLWRDFCKFFAVKHGDAIFFAGGTVGSTKKWSHFEKNFDAWREGRTGYPLVDANMREMKATGFMSNRGRQNVASFLAIDLEHDWRFGAEWFETQLLDYDVYSNWVNWCSAAGMTGGRLNRFNIVKQSKDYDRQGDYVRRWLPELKDVPTEFVHEPWKMTQFQQLEYNVRLGVDYPNPIVPPSKPRSSNGGNNNMGKKQGKQRRSNNNSKQNRHQKYEMKSLKEGRYEMK